MVNTLYPEDVILVNKLTYGPNLPQSPYEIPLVNIFYYLKNQSKVVDEKKIWKYKRLSGTSSIKRGDIVVFKNFDHDEVFVKRCVGLAGEFFKIFNGKIFVNNKLYETKRDKDYLWIRCNNYGEFLIPKAGLKIEITNDSFALYENIIKKYEHVNIEKDKNKFFAGGKEITHYIFKRSYYFMMGDNRNDSHDSRYEDFGIIPEEYFVGKVSCVLFSNKDNKFQWDRLLKGV